MNKHNPAVSNLPPDFPQAACRGKHELFELQNTGEPRETVDARHREAAAICWSGQCPHLAECNDWAITSHYDPRNIVGPVLGGMTSTERNRYRRLNNIPTPEVVTILDLYEISTPNSRAPGVDCGHIRDVDSDGRHIRCRECDRERHQRRRIMHEEGRRTA
jgi:hypothetical protein